MGDPIRLLVVEDSENDEAILLRTLRKGGLTVEHRRVDTEAGLRQALESQPWDLVVSDYSMPGFDGFSAFKVIRALGMDMPFIFVSGQLGEETAVEAMQLGAADYLTKGNLGRLVPAVQRELRKMEERRLRQDAEKALELIGRQLQQSQKMEALGRLAGGVAHDFNNLLTIMTGYLTMMTEAPDDVELRRQGLAQIQGCAERAAALTRQLLALGRRQPQQPRPVQLNLLVEDVGQMLKRVIGEDVKLTYSLGAGLSPVLADPGQLEQVLLNLVINARDAMPWGGVLEIGTAGVRLDARDLAGNTEAQPGPFVRLWVKDSGTGMDADLQARIFEPFFTTKPEGRGTGLGLSTAYGIVRQNRGHLRVESAPGAGSEFSVYLPHAEPKAAEPARPAAPASGGGHETVLVVEDEPALRDLVAYGLGRLGYKVLTVEDPQEALRTAASVQVDLLLTDVTMPVMDGRELARRFATASPKTRVLFMSGYAVDEERNLNESNCLAKPFSPAALQAKVREILDKEI